MGLLLPSRAPTPGMSAAGRARAHPLRRPAVRMPPSGQRRPGGDMLPAPRSARKRRCMRPSGSPSGRAEASWIRSSAIAGSPNMHGPHCCALWPARYRRIRAPSASPQTAGGRTYRTPAPGAPPTARNPPHSERQASHLDDLVPSAEVAANEDGLRGHVGAGHREHVADAGPGFDLVDARLGDRARHGGQHRAQQRRPRPPRGTTAAP